MTTRTAASTINVWLDDDLVDRAAPEGWIHVQTAAEAIDLLRTETVEALSLDHDLGDDEKYGTGYDVVMWLAEQSFAASRDRWPTRLLQIHSANFSASPRMSGVIDRYSPMTAQPGRRWIRDNA